MVEINILHQLLILFWKAFAADASEIMVAAEVVVAAVFVAAAV